MRKAGGRRIKRSLLIDQNSIRFLENKEILDYGKNLLMRDEINQIMQNLTAFNSSIDKVDHHPSNMSRISNIRIFRIFALNYISSRSDVKQDMKKMVRQLAPSPQGVKIEIYCFANTTDWVEYEEIQAQIIEHLLAIVPEFGLSIYQYPSNRSASSEPFLPTEV